MVRPDRIHDYHASSIQQTARTRIWHVLVFYQLYSDFELGSELVHPRGSVYVYAVGGFIASYS